MKTQNISPKTRAPLALVASLLVATTLCPLSAQIVQESFDYGISYPILPGENGGAGFGGAWNQTSVFPGGNLFYVEPGSLTYPNLVSNGEKLLFFGGTFTSLPFSETVTRGFASSLDNTSLTFYYLFSVEDVSQLYYSEVAFLGSLYNLRLHFQNINVGDNPSELLLEDLSTGKTIGSGTNLIYGQVVLGPGNDALSLWLNPDLLSLGSPDFTTSAFDYGALTGLRVIASSFDPNSLGALRLDEITVIPEPGTGLLLCGGLLGLVLLRKFCR